MIFEFLRNNFEIFKETIIFFVFLLNCTMEKHAIFIIFSRKSISTGCKICFTPSLGFLDNYPSDKYWKSCNPPFYVRSRDGWAKLTQLFTMQKQFGVRFWIQSWVRIHSKAEELILCTHVRIFSHNWSHSPTPTKYHFDYLFYMITRFSWFKYKNNPSRRISTFLSVLHLHLPFIVS